MKKFGRYLTNKKILSRIYKKDKKKFLIYKDLIITKRCRKVKRVNKC